MIQEQVRAWSKERVRRLNELGRALGRGESLEQVDVRLGAYLDWYMARTDPELSALEFLEAQFWRGRNEDG